MKQIPENLPCLISGRAVPLGFNRPQNRYPLPVACFSDTTCIQVWFYEYHGLYWYSVTVESRHTFNSVPFLSVQNAITEFRSFLSGYGFRFLDRGLAECRLSGLRRNFPPKSSEV